MRVSMEYTINCNGQLLSLDKPVVMGIMNVTPDSFYAVSRQQTEHDVAQRATEILEQGGSIIDVGACSTRPGSTAISEEEEMARLRWALAIVCKEMPQAIVSVDTFRPDVARMVVEEYGVSIINDVGQSQQTATGSQWPMGRMVSRLRVPYIYTSRQATMREVLMDCAAAVDSLRSMGQKDIILDPGFGFGKTVEQNFSIMSCLERLQTLELPVLVGISRKSMIWKTLDSSPEESLGGTTALHAIALTKGAAILRVHDVREAVECISLVNAVYPDSGSLIV